MRASSAWWGSAQQQSGVLDVLVSPGTHACHNMSQLSRRWEVESLRPHLPLMFLAVEETPLVLELPFRVLQHMTALPQ